MLDVSAFVGIPYVEHGRDKTGCDCWGLFWLLHQDLFGIDVGKFEDISANTSRTRQEIGKAIAAMKEAMADDWVPVAQDEIKPGDGILMRRGLCLSHVGLFIGKGLFIHTEKPGPSSIVRIASPTVRHTIVGYYRHRLTP